MTHNFCKSKNHSFRAAIFFACVFLAGLSCATNGAGGKREFSAFITSESGYPHPSTSTLERVFELVSNGNYSMAELYFSPEWLRQNIPQGFDFKTVAANDIERLREAKCRYYKAYHDCAEINLEYGDKLVTLFMVEAGTSVAAESLWVVSTREEFLTALQSSNPEKTLYGVYLAFVSKDVEKVFDYFTPYSKKMINNSTLRYISLFITRGRDSGWKEGPNWAVWQRTLDYDIKNPEYRGDNPVIMPLYFVKVDEKWLIAAKDEFDATVEIFGER